jgi:hypothetical protein
MEAAIKTAVTKGKKEVFIALSWFHNMIQARQFLEPPASGLQAKTCNKFDPTSPFGGCKESGFGREGGLQGLRSMCNSREIGAAMP